jgi:hypothetical protein
MFFNEDWNNAHTHGIPQTDEKTGPRISIAFLLGARANGETEACTRPSRRSSAESPTKAAAAASPGAGAKAVANERIAFEVDSDPTKDAAASAEAGSAEGADLSTTASGASSTAGES